MRTLGIDLATTKGSTGICEIDWHRRTSTVEVGQFPNEAIADRIRSVGRSGGWTAIDAPFGFPAAFSEAVHKWRTDGRLGFQSDHDIRRRLTDCYVAERQRDVKAVMPGGWNTWPLSSVVDLITPTVIRVAQLLTTVHEGTPVDRIGFTSHVLEVYPISALRIWGIATKDYKKVAADCDSVFEALCRLTAISRPLVIGSVATGSGDDAVDAFVCALLARVVALAGGTTGPKAVGDSYAAKVVTVRQEGWIHLPPVRHLPQALAAP